MRYIDLVLPLPLEGTFTYAVPEQFSAQLRPGIRVVVPFGSKKLYTGIIVLVHTQEPTGHQIREIISVLDEEPVLRRPQYKFWEWISNYYMCSPGEVFQAAVPAGLKLESETEVYLNEEYIAESPLTAKEQSLLDILQEGKPKRISDISRQLSIHQTMPLLKKLIDKGAIHLYEQLNEKYRPKIEVCVRLAEACRTEEALKVQFDELSRAGKQLALLMYYLDLSKHLIARKSTEVTRKELLEKSGISASVLTALVKREVLELYSRELDRLDTVLATESVVNDLNSFQQKALNQVELQFREKAVVLLHGVTSSGKTELYIQLIQKQLSEGRQVLYLVPEIALTTQLTNRLRRVFGNQLGVYHSRFSDAERVEIWNKVLHDKYQVVIGVRSSVFLPFRHLGLLIVDEEHDSSYKQYDPAPRYHARNAGIVLASMHGAKTLLGTATPSIESYYNAQNGKYGLVELNERFEEMEMPEIRVVDMKEAYRKKQHEGHFSDILLDHIREALANKEQIILFQNRRGYAPYIECKACAYIPKCEHCDVSLTLHAAFKTLNCHYCGYTTPIPDRCPVCHTPDLKDRGFGTEKIEDEIRQFFPEARVLRMDMDTTRSKKAFQKIISEFESEKVDILIGTQMVTKGLDFEKVSLVGVLNADNMLNFPDFRAHERAFQLMAQVAGRSGRKHKRGLVILQSSVPEHIVLKQVIDHDYQAMYRLQSQERELFKYPPYYRLIQLTLKHKDVSLLNKGTGELAVALRQVFGARLLGPVVPSVSRIQNLFIRQLLLKVEISASSDKTREYLHGVIKNVIMQKPYRSIRISIDVDPY